MIDLTSDFFWYARERYSVFLKKNAGEPRPWTEDYYLDRFKFCNVFREDDRTTIWLRENVREKLPVRELLMATIVFRWFNRIETGEAIFVERDYLGDGRSAWEHFWETRDVDKLRIAILAHNGTGPYVTGAYCIIGMPNMSKLDGILACIDQVMTYPSPSDISADLPNLHHTDLTYALLSTLGRIRLEQVWDWFRRYPRSGDFMAYEIVTDLNHTPGLMATAPDVMTWANAGPGAIRGLNRIHGRELERKLTKEASNLEMQTLLAASQAHWPIEWPKWDMRTVEHTLCEFDKYQRLLKNEGKVKGVYR